MYSTLFKQTLKVGAIRLNECIGKRVSRLWKLMVKFWFLTQNYENVLLFSHQTSSMKHHLREAHEHNFRIHNICILPKYLFQVSMV